MTLTIYGDRISGNCLKVKWIADRLGLTYDWVDIDVVKGEAKTPQFLKVNPSGQVPAVVLDDGRTLSQSNAIISYFAEGSDLIPADASVEMDAKKAAGYFTDAVPDAADLSKAKGRGLTE